MSLTAHSLVCLLTLWIATGCDRGASDAGTPLVVFAASSTTEAFRELADAFERAHPGTRVQLVFSGSQTLRLQLEQGASADVVATANEAHLSALSAGGVVTDVAPFATNRLTVIVPWDNPAGLESFDDLPNAERIVVGAPSVPVGAYTERLFVGAADRWGADKASTLRRHIVSRESNVRLVRAKVDLGEADAAVVYVTDGLGHAGVRMIPIPDDLNVRARYFVGRIVGAKTHPATELWIDFLRSARGREILARHGFETDDR